MAHDEPVHTRQEAMYSLYACILPVKIAIRRRSKERIGTGRIGAVALHHVIRRDNVAFALGHLGAILDDHSLSEKPGDRLGITNDAKIAHELGPEAGINQMQNGVFDAADVLINGKPIVNGFGIERPVLEMSTGVAIEVPGRIYKGVNGIRLSPHRTT